ncbi:hypothetical protein [Streptosporangium roseum]|uniref:Lipoprotein n=1 Tax=Streptosporangium roseum (strain ATCC 12428 / DSM 43021 / JCM 3005 / KCTC 9067 / NCIMB 10171 / NRRL 2505 / NI 9100) TaxID=479432 RepID=D2AYR9_STRRD|nr:hypothetical protein [Streptosporangium roseum]ACZ89052.1 hypothetical protein Sros_6331 [Streptosporangium roseum DSM 43021]
MPRSAPSFPVRLGVTLLATALTLAACGEREPTAVEAGATLKAHILKLLKEVNTQNIQITDPGGKDIPCGDGKFKRTFAAIGHGAPPYSQPIYMKDEMRGALGRVANYTSIGVPDLSKPATIADKSARTVLVLDASSMGRYLVSGETECLNQS